MLSKDIAVFGAEIGPCHDHAAAAVSNESRGNLRAWVIDNGNAVHLPRADPLCVHVLCIDIPVLVPPVMPYDEHTAGTIGYHGYLFRLRTRIEPKGAHGQTADDRHARRYPLVLSEGSQSRGIDIHSVDDGHTAWIGRKIPVIVPCNDRSA